METASIEAEAASDDRGEGAAAGRPLLLSLTLADAALLRRHPPLKAAARRSGVTRRVLRRFFDTADLACGAAGFAVGIIELGARRRLIVRDLREDASSGAPAHADAPLAGSHPDASAVVALVPALDGIITDAELGEIFAIESRRTVWSLAYEGGGATLALDAGRLITPRGAQDFADAALLLDRGTPSALHRFARELSATLRVHVEPRSIERRAYALLRGEIDAPCRAESPAFPPDATVADGLAAILEAGAVAVHRNLRAARGGNSEGVHQLRIACRRLRAILGVFAPALPEEERRRFAGEIKGAAERLAPIRSLDVFLAENIAVLRRALPDERALLRLEAAAEARRAAAWAAVGDEILPSATLLTLAAWADGGIWRDGAPHAMLARPLPEFINAALRRGRRRLKRRAADAEKEATVESLHALRIEAKKARYAAEAFRTLYRAKPARRYLTALERLQDVLGIVNDADTARQLAAELPLPARAARARDLVAGWTASEIEHGRRAFTAAWRDFLAAKPFWRE